MHPSHAILTDSFVGIFDGMVCIADGMVIACGGVVSVGDGKASVSAGGVAVAGGAVSVCGGVEGVELTGVLWRFAQPAEANRSKAHNRRIIIFFITETPAIYKFAQQILIKVIICWHYMFLSVYNQSSFSFPPFVLALVALEFAHRFSLPCIFVYETL
jgi:hypothetical protein